MKVIIRHISPAFPNDTLDASSKFRTDILKGMIMAPSSAKQRRVPEGTSSRRIVKATRACDACKARKTRCSGLKPCASCTARHVQCEYNSQYLRGRPPTPPPSIRQPELASNAEEDTVSTANEGLTTSDAHLPQSRGSPAADGVQLHGQYVDTTSGFSFLQRVRSRLEKASTESDDRQLPSLGAVSDKPLLGLPSQDTSAAGSTGCNPLMYLQLPDATLAEELLALYFEICVATYKPLHRPSVETWYHTAAKNMTQGLPISTGLGEAKVSTLLGVLAVATFHKRKSQGCSDGLSSLSDADLLFQCAVTLANEADILSLESAQARLIQTFYLLMTCRMNQAWFVFGNVLQIISALGMHRRDRRRQSQEDYVHAQCRRRTFWCTYILDKYLGVVMGRPRHFHDDDIDQQLPDRVDDEKMLSAAPPEEDRMELGDCHMDAFVWNIKLSKIIARIISSGLYSIYPHSQGSPTETTKLLCAEVDSWYSTLPAYLRLVKPDFLVRSFRRQSIALRLAHNHAIIHLSRPQLLSRLQGIDETFRVECIRRCLNAAKAVLEVVDRLAIEGPLFHAFWWTHYVSFCALTVVYVWDVQQSREPPTNRLELDWKDTLRLAERCLAHLSQATATNSPSRRYSAILTGLKGELQPDNGAQERSRHDRTPLPVDTPGPMIAGLELSPNDVPLQDDMYGSGPGIPFGPNVENPFADWQSSDWLDLDAFAYDTNPSASLDMW